MEGASRSRSPVEIRNIIYCWAQLYIAETIEFRNNANNHDDAI